MAEHRKRLLYVVTEDWYFVSHRLPLAMAAREAGFEVVLVSRFQRHRAALEAAGVRTISFEMARRGLNPFRVMREALRLAALYRRERPDVVHHVALRPVVVGGLAARLAGVTRVVSALAGMGFLFTDARRLPLLRRVLQRTLPWLVKRGCVITQNPEDAALLQGMGIREGSMVLLPGAGVDVEHFIPAPCPNGAPVVMMASRLLWDKGVGEFVEAARRLAGRARFVLVGAPDPDNPASVSREQVDGWVSQGIVEWWGHRENMADTLKAAAVVCLPSYREGMPKVLLEAMACGRACVTTDAPGCRDAVRHGDNGLLVPVKDAGALAGAIRYLLDDPEVRRQMGRQGRERAVAEFSTRRINAATLEIYQRMLAQQ